MAKLPDGRYTANPEYTGHISGKPRHVARFCGERISDHHTRRAAISACITYEDERQHAMTSAVALIKARRRANPALTALSAAVNRAIEEGAPVYTNKED